jgi:argininosuccinate lyase
MHKQQQESFSRKEIKKKIAEIKYLSSQKKIPKLTLRKEINHLEDKMETIFELEKSLLKRKRHESAKVSSLKKQIKSLQSQLVASADKDLHHKIGKLSYLLGESLAKKESGHDVHLAHKLVGEKVKTLPPQKKKIGEVVVEKVSESKLETVEEKIDHLKKELELSKRQRKDPARIRLLESKIRMIENKFASLKDKPVRHNVILTSGKLPEQEIKKLERELPLPPPPKMVEI